MLRIGLDLSSQPDDRVVHRARQHGLRILPQLAQELVPRHDLARSFSKVFEQFELPVRKVNLHRAVPRGARDEVDSDRTQNEIIGCGARAAKDRIDPRQQLVQVDRLGDVVIGPEIEPAKFVGFLTTRAQYEYRGSSALPERGAQIETIDVRQGDVEDDQVRHELPGPRQHGRAICDAVDIEPFEEQVLSQQQRHVHVVLDDQHSFFHRRSISPGGAAG